MPGRRGRRSATGPEPQPAWIQSRPPLPGGAAATQTVQSYIGKRLEYMNTVVRCCSIHDLEYTGPAL